jgi:hypothetical protein
MSLTDKECIDFQSVAFSQRPFPAATRRRDCLYGNFVATDAGRIISGGCISTFQRALRLPAFRRGQR